MFSKPPTKTAPASSLRIEKYDAAMPQSGQQRKQVKICSVKSSVTWLRSQPVVEIIPAYNALMITNPAQRQMPHRLSKILATKTSRRSSFVRSSVHGAAGGCGSSSRVEVVSTATASSPFASARSLLLASSAVRMPDNRTPVRSRASRSQLLTSAGRTGRLVRTQRESLVNLGLRLVVLALVKLLYECSS